MRRKQKLDQIYIAILCWFKDMVFAFDRKGESSQLFRSSRYDGHCTAVKLCLHLKVRDMLPGELLPVNRRKHNGSASLTSLLLTPYGKKMCPPASDILALRNESRILRYWWDV